MLTVVALPEGIYFESIIGCENCKTVIPYCEVNYLHSRFIGDLYVQMDLPAFVELQEVFASRYSTDERMIAGSSQYRAERIALFAG
jgi:hypothetical protein